MKHKRVLVIGGSKGTRLQVAVPQNIFGKPVSLVAEYVYRVAVALLLKKSAYIKTGIFLVE